MTENIFVNRFNKTREELLELYKYNNSNINVRKRKVTN